MVSNVQGPDISVRNTDLESRVIGSYCHKYTKTEGFDGMSGHNPDDDTSICRDKLSAGGCLIRLKRIEIPRSNLPENFH